MLTNQSPPAEVAAAIIAETKRRGYTRDESIACVSTGIQESGLRMVWDSGQRWFGYFQQDRSYPNRANPEGNIAGFLDRLDVKRKSPGASPDPFKNIFWLQQRPSDPSADIAYAKGRKPYYDEIKRHIVAATAFYDQFAGEKPMGWRGDPVWLPDVLRAEGLVCHIFPGAFERGHGDMGQIWGVMAHHTGSFGETPNGIANHPTLGLCSQLYLSRSGEYTLCGVGVAWHGGNGSYPGITDVNSQLIGIEAANDGGGTPGKPHRASWSDAQYDAYTRGVAAILRKLGHGPDRVIGHKEWAGKAQGKWDPGALDMNIFRRDVAARLGQAGGTELTPEQDKMLRELHAVAFNRIPSQSKYKTEGEGARWQLHELVKNDDAMIHEMLVERQAMAGNPEALALVKREADKGDKWAKVIYDYCVSE